MSARRNSVLREMGLGPIWRLRAAEQAVADGEVTAAAATPVPDMSAPTADAIASPILAAPAALVDRPEQAPVRPREPHSPRPVTDFIPSKSGFQAPAAAPAAGSADPARARHIATLEWDALETAMRACTACRLCEKRRQAVPGVGDRQAEWMFVGEGPGAEEDQRGEPFVGAAGKLLDAMLAAIGLQRGHNVYIANAVKCRPPHNRTPQADEIATCQPYLMRQIALVRPRVLVALGRPAALALLNTELAIGASRGRPFHCGDIPVVVTYHPAYLLRNQADKAKAWEDLCFARRLMAEAGGKG